MFGTIIVGVDGQQGGRDALALAGALAQATGSELIAACTFPYESAPTRTANKAYRQAMIDASRETLVRELADRVQARALLVQDLSVARGLHRLAEQQDAGLIVVGAPQRGRVGTVLLGNVTHNVLSAAPCAVAVAPRDFARRPIAVIGVGFDASPEAHRALELAGDLARETRARLEVVFAVDPYVPMPNLHAPVVDVVAVRDQQQAEARERLDEAVRGIDVELSADVVGGPAVPVLSELSRRVDLLVLGSRNYGPVRRLVAGSTSHAMVAHSECAVLALPRGVEPDADAESLETIEVVEPAL